MADFNWQPAVYSKLPRLDYDHIPGNNSSKLKVLASKTPAHAYHAYWSPVKGEQRCSAALRQGILLHQRILEPELWKTVRICTSGAATKAFAEMARKAEVDGAIVAQEEEYERVMAMADSVLAHPELGPMFAPTEENVALNELTLTWSDPSTSEPCKARLDAVRVTDEGLSCLDLKSCMDAGPVEFGKSAANFFYILQASFYADGLFYCAKPLEELLRLPEGTLQGRPVTFEFVAIEKESPHLVARYQLTAEQAALGRDLYRRALRVITEATRCDSWAGYDLAPKPLQLPGWALTQYENLINSLSES